MSFIRFKDLGKRYGDRWALKRATGDVKKGEIVAIVGPSGSGKSTVLRCINRLAEADRGAVKVEGVNVKEIEPPILRRRIGMVFQFPAVFPGTVKENLLYGMDIWEIPDEGVTSVALEEVGLHLGFLERDAEKLSGGEQQRVCLARSLVIGSEALLLDEPTASLDNKAASKVERTILDLKENRELAILWVTHSTAQARRVADRVLYLKDGRVRSFAPAEEFDWERWVGDEAAECCTTHGHGGGRHE